MPDDNKTTQPNQADPLATPNPISAVTNPVVTDTPPTPTVPEVPELQTAIPSESMPSFINMDSSIPTPPESVTEETPPTVKPIVEEQPSMPEEIPPISQDSSSAPSFDIPTMVTPPGKPKGKVGGKVIATILGILLLIGGIGAGLYLVGQRQLLNQKAYVCADPQCTIKPDGTDDCGTGKYCTTDSNGCVVCKVTATAAPTTSPPPSYTCVGTCMVVSSCSVNNRTNGSGTCWTPAICCGDVITPSTKTCNDTQDRTVAIYQGKIVVVSGSSECYIGTTKYLECSVGQMINMTTDYLGSCITTPPATVTCNDAQDRTVAIYNGQNVTVTGSSECYIGTTKYLECPVGKLINMTSDYYGSCITTPAATSCMTGTPVCIPDHIGGACNEFGEWCVAYHIGEMGFKNCSACVNVKGGTQITGVCDGKYYCITANSIGSCIENTTCNWSSQQTNPADEQCTPDTTGKCSTTPTTPPSNPPTPICLNIKAYDTNWIALTAAQLTTLEPGDIVRFAVKGTNGTFDKAQFKINNAAAWTESTAKKPSTQEFYIEYTIPEGITSFTVQAQVHVTGGVWK